MSKENLEKKPSQAEPGTPKVQASDCPQNPPCTACTLLRCKSGCPTSSCATCTFLPQKCSLSSISNPKPSPCCPPSPCAPRCPPSPLCCSPKCPPPPSCCPPPLSCPSPRCTLPPRCFRCCQVTCGPSPPSLTSLCPPKKSCCDPPICPPPRCPPLRCPPSKYDLPPSCCPPPKCDPCALPKCPPPCCPPPKCDPCALPKCPPPCCPPPKCPPSPPCCPPPPCPPPCPTEPKAATPPPAAEDPCPKTPPPVHRCPSDVEAERPKCFTESISGDETWEEYGVRIKYTDPQSPGTSSVMVGQPLTVKLCLEVKASSCLSADLISASMWTHMKTMCNPCGTWKDLPLHYCPEQFSTGECGAKRYVYSSTLTPTDNDTFRLTFNIKWGNILIWANNFGDDNMVGVGGN